MSQSPLLHISDTVSVGNPRSTADTPRGINYSLIAGLLDRMFARHRQLPRFLAHSHRWRLIHLNKGIVYTCTELRVPLLTFIMRRRGHQL
jgi:hypothetical protein